MKYLVLVLLIPLLLTSCLQQDEIKNEPSSSKQVFLDWEQINDPKIPIHLLYTPPEDLSANSDSNKSHFIFRYKVDNLEMFDTNIYFNIYTSVFDNSGNYIRSFDNTNEFISNQKNSFSSVGGESTHEISFAEADAYSSSITFVRQFKNKNN